MDLHFAKVVKKDDVLRNDKGSLSVQLYVRGSNDANEYDLFELLTNGRYWERKGQKPELQPQAGCIGET